MDGNKRGLVSCLGRRKNNCIMLIIKKKKLFVGRNSRDEQFCFNFLVVLIYFQLHLNLFIPTNKSYDLDKKNQSIKSSMA